MAVATAGADPTAPRPATVPRRRLLRANARFRILGWFVLLVVVTIFAALVLQREILERRLTSQVDQLLNEETAALRRAADLDPGRPVAELVDEFLAANPPGPDEVHAAFEGGRIHRVDDALEPVPVSWAALTRPMRGWNDGVRWLAVPIERDGTVAGVFVVGRLSDAGRAAIGDALEVGALVSLSVLAVTTLIAWAVAGRVLVPVRLATDTARAIGETDLRQRIPVTSDDELGELVRTFNAMLDRLESGFATQRAFIHDAGHELRTPITVIRGQLELMGDDPDERRDTIDLVTDELDRMARLVNDLLLLAKAERPGFLRHEHVEVVRLLEDVETKARALGDRRWRVEPSAAPTIVVTGDRQRLTQALMNLATNAVEHTRPGDEIVFGVASRDDGMIRVWVRDTGSGIAPDEQEHIFERFARGRVDGRRPHGAGLGLAIVRAIAEAHGGAVSVESRPGGGATFTIDLPVARQTGTT